MTEHDARLVELPVRLSDSKLWQIQRNYFETMGIAAWKEEVPFYISSNTFVAERYAQIVASFMRDWINHHGVAQDPFYIAELGSGTGKFSFYFLRALEKLLQQYQLDARFCYVITDIIENNLKFCRENASFRGYIEQGVVDFACFNVEEDTDFNLQIQGKSFSQLNLKTPLIVIANYTFDCVRQDIFEINTDKITQINIGLRSRFKNFDVQKAKYLNELQIEYFEQPVTLDSAYSNLALKNILQGYVDSDEDRVLPVIMPLGAMQFFDHMQQLTKGNFMIIAGDKGFTNIAQFPNYVSNYHATYDGCYSFFVNFHALAHYCQQLGGHSLLSDHRNDFKVNLYGMGFDFNQMKLTRGSFELSMETTGPDEYCAIYDEFRSCSYRFNIRSIISFLRFSRWDPDAYGVVHDRLMELSPGITQEYSREVQGDILKVRDNVYRMQIGQDVYNLMGIFFQFQDLDEQALALYQQSIDVFGSRAAPYNNSAMIYEKQKNFPKALELYEKSLALDKTNRFAYNKILKLSGRTFRAALYPLGKATLVVALLGILIYMITK